MIGNTWIQLVTALGVALITFGVQVRAADIGTAFTYQGFLESGSPPAPVDDTCDFRFGLWDAAAGGNQKGASPQTVAGISVAEGVFPATMDFGSAAIDGTARWLEIEVKCTGDADFVPLLPRVKLTPTPHALALPGMYTQQNSFSPNVVGGLHENTVSSGVAGATIAGGGAPVPDINRVTDTFGAIGGGCTNRAGNNTGSATDAQFATVGGGFSNTAGGAYTAIGGGFGNTADGDWSTIGGGISNTAGQDSSTVAGGTSNSATGYRSTVGGGDRNTSSGPFSTIAGGFFSTASMGYSTVAGGNGNTAGGIYTTIGGGLVNTANGDYSTVGGGHSDAATGDYSIVGGGNLNTASGDYSTVAGGQNNIAFGNYAAVPGGYANVAAGAYSFAAGRRAKVRDLVQVGGGDTDGDEGTFVWADSTDADFQSTGPNQFLTRASGGMKFYSDSGATVGVQLASGGNSWSAISDRNVKENITPLDPRDILERLHDVPVTMWNLKSQIPSIRHIGPMAQDFHDAFRLGESERYISSSDADGVALAAIQGLYEIVQEKDCAIEELKARLTRLEAILEISNVASLRLRDQGGSVVPESRHSATKAVGDGAIFDGTQKGEKP